jgi:hypothetical protein
VKIGNTPIEVLRIAPLPYAGAKRKNNPFKQVQKKEDETEDEFNKRLSAAIIDTVKDAALVVSMIAGSMHNGMTLIEHERPFDFVLEEEPDLPILSGREILPTKVFLAAMEEINGFWFGLFDFIRAHHKGPFIHIESPPPMLEDHIRKHPKSFADDIARVGVSPASIRYKSWRLHSKLHQIVMADLGGYFLPVPPESQDENGFLFSHLAAEDPIHGSPAYGELIYQQLVPIIDHLANDTKFAA